ncbi:bestrophin family protein [Paraflavitalea pollutisoli]|uniref:bestrophin family protein n=1 Tax=Paraflavitalea pollutisoli TaxID=3034143 RepID=UPI0023EBE041|nr:bestrophin family ion channel [Paraflavitalea sp. H1-2-19X]
MIIHKFLSLSSMYAFTGRVLWWLAGWVTLVAVVYHYTGWPFMAIPWLPLSLVGVAVAFYVGFKNSHAYDRLWGATRIWTGIENNSRKMSTMIKHYRSDDPAADDSLTLRKELIYRHIAYLYQLRAQLLEPAPWEHVSLGHAWGMRYNNRRRHEQLNALFRQELAEVDGRPYLSAAECAALEGYANKAAQLLDQQSKTVQELYRRKAINMLQQAELQGAIGRFYDAQGEAERIKQTPFPRKYASFSFAFVCIFLFLLPFGVIGAFSALGAAGTWLSIPIGIVIGYIYAAMEMVGDYSENPFEGLRNDVPMLSICRSIEIDLLQMMGDTGVPAPITPKGEVLL